MNTEQFQDAVIEMMDRQVRFLAYLASSSAVNDINQSKTLKEVLNRHYREIDRQDELMKELNLYDRARGKQT